MAVWKHEKCDTLRLAQRAERRPGNESYVRTRHRFVWMLQADEVTNLVQSALGMVLSSRIAKLWNIMLRNRSISFIAKTLPGQLYLPCPKGRKSNLDKSFGFAIYEAFAYVPSRSKKRLGLNLSASAHNFESFCTTTGQTMISCPAHWKNHSDDLHGKSTHKATRLQVHWSQQFQRLSRRDATECRWHANAAIPKLKRR